ncbi:MAG: NlpC/P60 family protein [Desulfovibrionaceae bacterium]|nr:NlpC/P60 family protein [Desulfovibrionaceae bacterium]
MQRNNWTDRYIGIPFKEGGRDFAGCDCGGLALLVLREECGVRALDFTEYEKLDFAAMPGYAKLGRGIEGLMEKEWAVVHDAIPFDLVRFYHGRYPCHVGIWAGHGNAFLHVDEAGKFSRLTSMTDMAWGKRFFEFRRHQTLMQRGAA